MKSLTKQDGEMIKGGLGGWGYRHHGYKVLGIHRNPDGTIDATMVMNFGRGDGVYRENRTLRATLPRRKRSKA